MKRLSELFRFAHTPGWAIALMRVVTGIVFLAHGYQKIFVQGVSNFADFLSQAGVPAPHLVAPVVAAIELLGGLALILGLLTRWAAVPLAIVMLVAAVVVHWKQGFFLPNGYEYTLVLLAANVSLFLAGAGEFALDNLRMGKERVATSQPATA